MLIILIQLSTSNSFLIIKQLIWKWWIFVWCLCCEVLVGLFEIFLNFGAINLYIRIRILIQIQHLCFLGLLTQASTSLPLHHRLHTFTLLLFRSDNGILNLILLNLLRWLTFFNIIKATNLFIFIWNQVFGVIAQYRLSLEVFCLLLLLGCILILGIIYTQKIAF